MFADFVEFRRKRERRRNSDNLASCCRNSACNVPILYLSFTYRLSSTLRAAKSRKRGNTGCRYPLFPVYVCKCAWVGVRRSSRLLSSRLSSRGTNERSKQRSLSLPGRHYCFVTTKPSPLYAWLAFASNFGHEVPWIVNRRAFARDQMFPR